MLAPNLDPPNLQNQAPTAGRARFFKKSFFRNWHRFLIDLGANLPPFPSQNSPKSLQKSILEGIDFLIDFCVDVLSILAPSWASMFDCFLIDFWCQLRRPKPSKFLSIFALIFYRCSFDLGRQLGAMLAPKTPPRRLPRRHQDSPRATRAPKIEIAPTFRPKVR